MTFTVNGSATDALGKIYTVTNTTITITLT